MDRDQFIAEFLDETVGLLLRSYGQAAPRLSHVDNEALGHAMIDQMKKAKDLLGRVYDRITRPEPKVLPATPNPRRTA